MRRGNSMETKFDLYFSSLKGKEVAVLGLGVSNRPLVKLLLDAGCRVVGCDKTPREKLDAEVLELEKAGCRLQLGESYLDGITAELVFRTPGMHPENPALVKLRENGAKITSEMDVFFQVCPCNLIAVTGSDGKTTTTTLISEMLKAQGKTVWLGGNIGTPLLPLCGRMQAEDYAVVELSSFQLMDMTRSPRVAVITNLSPNHLDVHKDMEEYVEAKKNIYRFQGEDGVLIVNADNAITAPLKNAGTTRYFSHSAAVKNGTYLEGDQILRDGKVLFDKHRIVIPGEHNVENYMAAILAVEGLVEDETIARVASTFGGVEHRIEMVREKDGVRFYNDSIASSPSRTMAGLQSFRQEVILIAGGYDKQIPFEPMAPLVCQKVKTLILNGATAEKIRQAIESCPDYRPGHPEIRMCSDFTAATRQAVEIAREGDIVLMSPACAAFDQFKNFMERGNYFKKLIKEL